MANHAVVSLRVILGLSSWIEGTMARGSGLPARASAITRRAGVAQRIPPVALAKKAGCAATRLLPPYLAARIVRSEKGDDRLGEDVDRSVIMRGHFAVSEFSTHDPPSRPAGAD